MGKRGPRPQTKSAATLKGSRRAKNKQAPTPSSERPGECPTWLEGEARALWDRQAQLLARKGLWSRDYQDALAMYCEAWGEYVDCVQKLHGLKELTVATDKGNLVQHPLVSMRNKAFDRALRLGQHFGFSPTAQVDVPAPKKPQGSAIAARKRE